MFLSIFRQFQKVTSFESMSQYIFLIGYNFKINSFDILTSQKQGSMT